MALFDLAPTPKDQPEKTERVGFDVRISSPALAYAAIGRVYLNCVRQVRENRLMYKGQRVAKSSVPDFNLIKQQAMYNFVSWQPALGIFR